MKTIVKPNCEPVNTKNIKPGEDEIEFEAIVMFVFLFR